ncbi:MAG: dephospho-CoA kinase [Cyclobacteriaceae bacterium]|jgi:dephospho-CoA kinase
MANSPFQMGITGGIGAGKSTVAKIFSILGIPVYNADNSAKMLMNSDASLMAEIRQLFGDQAYLDGKLNRSLLADKAFKDPSILARLNATVHPVVAEDYALWLDEYQHVKFTLKEAALLIETGSNMTLDGLILVTAPEEIRISRVLQRDSHRNKSDVIAIMSNQLSDVEKKKKADFIIENDGRQSLIEQTLAVYNQVLSNISR